MNISLFKSQKKGFTYLQVLTWRAGPPGKLMWHARPPRGCDVALRPRGRAWVAHARRMWRTGRRHVAGGHACPRVHAMPVWGTTWQERSVVGGPTGIVGPVRNWGR